MGKDLNGKALGKGIGQRKDGRYEYRKCIDGYKVAFYSFNLEDIHKFDEKLKKLIINKCTAQDIENLKKEFCKTEDIDESLQKPNVGYIYFISNGKHCKIGRTTDIKSRFSSLKTSSSEPLEIVFYFKTIDLQYIEKQLHKLFSKYHVKGEWYDILFLFDKYQDVHEDLIKKYVDNVKDKIEDGSVLSKFNDKVLLNVSELMEYTGIGEKKIRQMLKDPNSTFTVRNGSVLYAHKKSFEKYLSQCTLGCLNL